ncbi:MAG: heavy-metal-associated domain-containing protein [Phycisphaerae bacterium]|nr:heavy-metal-associated domain-containing protein [Phycisphaerae bacterium]
MLPILTGVLTLLAPVPTPTATLTVNGLSCPLCANSIDKQFARMGGVRKVDIDLGEGKVHVFFGEGKRPNLVTMAKAIDAAGFTVTGFSIP